MQIAPSIASATIVGPRTQGAPLALAQSAPAPGAEVGHELLAGEQLPADAPRSPAGDFVRERGRDLLAIPGAVSISWRAGDDVGTVRINFVDTTGAALAKGLLETRVDGVEIVVGIWQQKEPYAGDVAARTGDLVRAVAAMPGVWDYKYAETSPFADGHVTFRTISRDVTARLDPLLRGSIAFGHTPNGSARSMHVHWRSGVPAGS